MRTIGFSHGVMYKSANPSSVETVEAFLKVAPDIIEINVHQPERLDEMGPVIESFKKFSRRSLHLSCGMDYGRNELAKMVMAKSEDLYAKTGCALALVHPDLVSDWSIFDGSQMKLAVENMDNRKQAFKGIEDFQKFFAEHDDWKLVLDLNHCFTNDPTLKLAQDFIDSFKPRITEIHLSGFAGFHEPLFQTKQLDILNYCKQLPDADIVIESVIDNPDDLAREYEYIIENLGK